MREVMIRAGLGVLAIVTAWQMMGCRHRFQDEFGYETLEETSLESEYGTINVRVIEQFDTDSTMTAEIAAQFVLGEMRRYEREGLGVVDRSTSLEWTIFVGDNDSTVWNEMCRDDPYDSWSILGCSYTNGWLFPAIVPLENQIAIVDFHWIRRDLAGITLSHEIRHNLRACDIPESGGDFNHLDDLLWEGVR